LAKSSKKDAFKCDDDDDDFVVVFVDIIEDDNEDPIEKDDDVVEKAETETLKEVLRNATPEQNRNIMVAF